MSIIRINRYDNDDVTMLHHISPIEILIQLNHQEDYLFLALTNHYISTG
jgi:hypothetical protein